VIERGDEWSKIAGSVLVVWHSRPKCVISGIKAGKYF
jgi:hypothetical protein